MTGTIQAITFDLDGTMLDSPADDRAATRAVATELLGVAPGPALSKLMAVHAESHTRVWAPVLASPPPTEPEAWDPRRILRLIWEDTIREAGVASPPPIEALVERWLSHYTTSCTLFADTGPAVAKLRAHYKLAIITNGTACTQHPRIECSGLYPLMDHVSIAGEKGFGKPRPEIFVETLSCLGIEAGRAVHVGDSLHADITGARNAGLKSVWVNRGGEVLPAGSHAPDLEIRTLAELPAAISMLNGRR
ncbi:MAG: HAD family hydrolase [SAR202 cluster bacterium]|nr:HAD family hydrolase [SAR202 cluster bacterium]